MKGKFSKKQSLIGNSKRKWWENSCPPFVVFELFLIFLAALIPGERPEEDCIDGLWQTHAPLGCFTDINATRSQVQEMVPGVSIFAIGVGPKVNNDTLKVISSSPNGWFASPSWEDFLAKLQDIITLTCVEPDPITSCGMFFFSFIFFASFRSISFYL